MQRGKLTPNSNVRWESSRMMLPEHREAIVQARKDWERNGMQPLLDEEWKGEWNGQLYQAWKRGRRVRLVRWQEEQQELRGKIRSFDPTTQRVELWVERTFDAQILAEVYELERVWIEWSELVSFEVIG